MLDTIRNKQTKQNEINHKLQSQISGIRSNMQVQVEAHNNLQQQVTFEKIAETVKTVAKPSQVSLKQFCNPVRTGQRKD